MTYTINIPAVIHKQVSLSSKIACLKTKGYTNEKAFTPALTTVLDNERSALCNAGKIP